MACCLAVVFVNTVYLVGAVLGGATSVNLSNYGPAFQYFYTTGAELASARWWGYRYRIGDLVYADEYGQVPLAAATKISTGLLTDLTPKTLNSHAWVYASQANVRHGYAFALYNEHLATYVFPSRIPQCQLQPGVRQWLVAGVPPMISVVIISKDEAVVDATLAEVTAQARAAGLAEVLVVDASGGHGSTTSGGGTRTRSGG